MGKKEEKDWGNQISPVYVLYRGVTGVAAMDRQDGQGEKDEKEGESPGCMFTSSWGLGQCGVG